MRRLIARLLLALALFAPAPGFADERVVVFAAASLKTALDEAAAMYRAEGGGVVEISYGGSLALARQIVAGAPADIFASADEASMDVAVQGAAIQVKTRIDFLTNRLVLIAPKSAGAASVKLERAAFAAALDGGRLATGEVETVPAGRYAKAALTKLGLWDLAAPHLAMTDNVRAALAFVARGEARLGIVYASDAAVEPDVRVVAEFPDDAHPPIAYPFALTTAAHGEAENFLAFLRGPQARALFVAQGFGVTAR